MLPLKAVLVSTGVISMVVVLNFSLPVILDFVTSELPLFWSFALSWLRPPYLYLLINCIIISIVASSKLQPRGGEETLSPSSAKIEAEVREVAAMIDVSKEEEEEKEVVFGYVESPAVKVKEHHLVSPVKSEVSSTVTTGNDVEERESLGDGDDYVISKTMEKSTPIVASSPISSAEKPSFSTRFGHRRAVKGSPEGKAVLKVSKPKRRDTLESTWRTITDGRSMPLTRHLKKSDTFAGASPEKSPVRTVKKSDTFAVSSSPASGSAKMRREPSLSQDELNRRVEAFIKKFNEEMRLQRQDSLNQYNEMVGGRGSQ
ncbi:Nucleoside diphosphate-linked moiety X motif 17 [Bienertia sinuspersici]